MKRLALITACFALTVFAVLTGQWIDKKLACTPIVQTEVVFVNETMGVE